MQMLKRTISIAVTYLCLASACSSDNQVFDPAPTPNTVPSPVGSHAPLQVERGAWLRAALRAELALHIANRGFPFQEPGGVVARVGLSRITQDELDLVIVDSRERASFRTPPDRRNEMARYAQGALSQVCGDESSVWDWLVVNLVVTVDGGTDSTKQVARFRWSDYRALAATTSDLFSRLIWVDDSDAAHSIPSDRVPLSFARQQ